MWKRFQNVWNRLTTPIKVIAIFLAMAAVGAVIDATDGDGKFAEGARAKPAQVASTPKPAKNLAQRVFGDKQYIAYTNSDDGRILASFHVWEYTKESAENDVRRFMDALMRESGDWTSATVSAYATFHDNYGKERQDVVLTYTFQRAEAAKVVDWWKANLVAVGLREYVVPKLR